MDPDYIYSFGIAFVGTILYLLVHKYEKNAYLAN
jgi:hypothetical protein